MIVADSDVLIDFLRGQGDGARSVVEQLEKGSLATTAITAFEIRSGAHSAKQRKSVEALLGALAVLPFGADEARLAADLRQKLEKDGRGIGMADYLIAAICLSHGAALLTRNRKHFERVEGLQLGGARER